MTTPDYRQPRDGNRYIDVSSDYERRYHYREDRQASTFDIFAVCLPPYLNEPGLIAHSFEQALTTLATLQGAPMVPLYPPEVWQPMGIITATSLETVNRDMAIRVAMMDGGTHLTDEESSRDPMPAERRVAALARAIALLRGAPLPKGSMENWRGLVTLQ